jgi:hypothetical protein
MHACALSQYPGATMNLTFEADSVIRLASGGQWPETINPAALLWTLAGYPLGTAAAILNRCSYAPTGASLERPTHDTDDRQQLALNAFMEVLQWPSGKWPIGTGPMLFACLALCAPDVRARIGFTDDVVRRMIGLKGVPANWVSWTGKDRLCPGCGNHMSRYMMEIDSHRRSNARLINACSWCGCQTAVVQGADDAP